MIRVTLDPLYRFGLLGPPAMQGLPMQESGGRSGTQRLVEAMRRSQYGAGRLDRVDDGCQVPAHLLPAPQPFGRTQPIDTPHEVDKARERRAGVGVKRTRREQDVPGQTAQLTANE